MERRMSIWYAGATIALLSVCHIACAQLPTNVVGVPISSTGNPGGASLVLVDFGRENQVNLVGEPGVYPFATVFPGDRVLVNGTGGNDLSNWLAVDRFFNPADPTGSLGLPATESQAFFARDLGPAGFAGFQLFPKVNFTRSTIDQFGSVVGSDSVFGPAGGIFAGQLLIIQFIALPSTSSAVPEPGAFALLGSMGVAGSGFLLNRRTRARKHRLRVTGLQM